MIRQCGMRPRRIIWKKDAAMRIAMGESLFSYSWLKTRYGAKAIFLAAPYTDTVRFTYDPRR